MGVFGWRERQDMVTLIGVAKSHAKADDGDWTLIVEPDAGSRALLLNNNGKRNADGMVECEVEPSDFIEDGPVQSWEPHLFGPLIGKRVTVTGTWSDDLSHDDKTEIHPIVSLFAEETFDATKFVQLFAFADDSGNFPATVPHSGENRFAHVRIPFPPKVQLPHHHLKPQYRIKNSWYHVRSAVYRIDETVTPPVLDVLIETGIADENKGFYFSSLVLDYDDQRLAIPYDEVPLSNRLHVTHIEQRLTGSLRKNHGIRITAIGGTDQGVFWKLRTELAITLLRSKSKAFFTRDQTGDEADLEVVEPHRTSNDEFFFPFLRTGSDNSTANNLLALPKCPTFLDELP
jgi:hypothetical protein